MSAAVSARKVIRANCRAGMVACATTKMDALIGRKSHHRPIQKRPRTNELGATATEIRDEHRN